MSMWDSMNYANTMGIVDDGVAIARNMRESKRIDEANRKFRAGYAVALEQAKRTGVMPEQYQKYVPIDAMGEQIGLKVVALRELGKNCPAHPLVTSQNVRNVIARQTLMNYNKSNRPDDVEFADFAPNDASATHIFKHAPK